MSTEIAPIHYTSQLFIDNYNTKENEQTGSIKRFISLRDGNVLYLDDSPVHTVGNSAYHNSIADMKLMTFLKTKDIFEKYVVREVGRNFETFKTTSKVIIKLLFISKSNDLEVISDYTVTTSDGDRPYYGSYRYSKPLNPEH